MPGVAPARPSRSRVFPVQGDQQLALYAPAGTSRPILATINQIVTDGMNAPAMTKRLATDGSEPAERTPDEFKAVLTREYDEVEKQIRALNLKLF